MKILVVGQGGREHTLVWKLGTEPTCRKNILRTRVMLASHKSRKLSLCRTN